MSFKEIKPEELQKNTFQMIGKEWLLVTAEKDGKANTMTASWGGVGVMWDRNVHYLPLCIAMIPFSETQYCQNESGMYLKR